MEIKILSDGYKNNEAFYQDFLNGTIEENPDYFSEVSVELDKAEDFPIYMAKGSDEEKKAEFKKAFQVLARDYINTSRDVNMDELFWHSFLCVKKREYILQKYPEVRDSIDKFHNIVLKKFDWENYIYKCVIGAQYVEDNATTDEEKDYYYDLIINNLDVYNYILKYSIFRNDQFLLNVLSIIDELGLSEICKAKITDRPDLGADERYGRRVIFEFNKSYPIVMAPMLDKEELKEYFMKYLGMYYDLTKLDLSY